MPADGRDVCGVRYRVRGAGAQDVLRRHLQASRGTAATAHVPVSGLPAHYRIPHAKGMTTSDMLTVGQAARMLGLSPERVRQLARAGTLPVEATPYGRVFDRATVGTYIARREARQRQRRGRRTEMEVRP